MKLTKTAVALAVAASFAAIPMTASATTTLSGLVQIKLQGTDEDDDPGTPEKEGDPEIAAGDVLFGITSEHTMSNGLTGYGSVRLDLDRLSNGGTDVSVVDGTDTEVASGNIKTAGSADSVYVGVKGGFGDLRFGEIPLAVEYGQLSNDIYDVGAEINGGVSYVGSFGPASVIANWSPGRNSDAVGVGAKFSIGGFSIGVGTETRDDLANTAFGASFGYAGASIGIHAATKENEGAGADDTEIFGIKVGYGIGPVSLGLTHMTQEEGNAEEDTTRLDIVYDMGGDTELSSRINSFGGDADGSDWRIQLTKFF